jgi:hypothetical protein
MAVFGVDLVQYADLFLWLLHFLQTVLLLVTSLFLLYPVVRHPRNVANGRGVGLLSAGFLLLSAQWALEFVPLPTVVARLTALAAACCLLAGAAAFAGDFVETKGLSLRNANTREPGGGFPDDEHE